MDAVFADPTIQFVRDPRTMAVSGFVLSTGRIQNMKFRKSPMTSVRGLRKIFVPVQTAPHGQEIPQCDEPLAVIQVLDS